MTITVNKVPITEEMIHKEAAWHAGAESPETAAKQALVIREVLVQHARTLGFEVDSPGEAGIDAVIDQLIDREVAVPQPGEDEYRRYYENNLERFRAGEWVEAAHILFEVRGSAPLQALRLKANEVLREILADPSTFEARASALSNCPSGANGGHLGRLKRGETVPEFERIAFGLDEGEIHPRLAETRFGLHIVKVSRRHSGSIEPFDAVRSRIERYLHAASRRRAISQYLQILVGKARVRGVRMQGAMTPLVQ